MSNDVFTVGHSNREFGEFVKLLETNGVNRVIDVRAFPGLRANPQFNRNVLPENLYGVNIDYTHLEKLGGRRATSQTADSSPNGLWRNKSFQNYADYALTEAFHQGLHDLKESIEVSVCALMCSEAVWWRCHRRIIADYLLADRYRVFHILSQNSVPAAQLTKGAVIRNGDVIYPPTDES